MRPRSVFFIMLAFTMLIILGAIFGGVSYLTRKIRLLTLSPRFLHLTFVPAALTGLAMLITLGLLLFQVISIDLYVNTRGLTLLIVPFLNVIVGCITFPTIIACISLWRGFKARQELMVLV
jgi:hypothetical protein